MPASQRRNTEPDRDAGPGSSRADISDDRRGPAGTDLPGSGVYLSSLKLPYLIAIALSVAVIDQSTKWIISSRFFLHESVVVMPGIFSITRIHNSGIAFGLFPGLPSLFMLVTLVSMIVVVYFYLTVEVRNTLLTIGCALILGGALGNLIDRFRLGYVVDFLNFSFWPAFNVADSAVTTGVALLLVSLLREKEGAAQNASDSL